MYIGTPPDQLLNYAGSKKKKKKGHTCPHFSDSPKKYKDQVSNEVP